MVGHPCPPRIGYLHPLEPISASPKQSPKKLRLGGLFIESILATLLGMNDLLDIRPGHWNLHVLPRYQVTYFVEACGYLARSGPLLVLDCNRQYNPSLVLRAALGREENLNRIKSRRAFNCFETAILLQTTPVGNAPVVVFDPLNHFYNEHVPYNMRQFLLGDCIKHIQRLSKGAGLAVVVQPVPDDSPFANLYNRLVQAAPQVIPYASHGPEPVQERIF